LPPAPVEITRPELVGFGENDIGGLNIPLQDPVAMIFNEKMDPNSFDDAVILQSISGMIDGEFSLSSSADSVVIFTPSVSMNPAERYEVTVTGAVRDANGNSMLSPVEDQTDYTTWFFTTGSYAEGGFPYVFISDRLGEIVYRVGSVNAFIDSATISESSQEMRFTPDGSKLIIVNKANPGFLNIVDPETMTLMNSMDVGVGSEHIYLTNEKAYVSDVSGKTITIVDLGSMTIDKTISFDDGFAPRDIVYSVRTERLYLTSNSRNDFAKIRVIDPEDPETAYDIEDVLPTNRSQDMEISPNGDHIFINELRSTNLIIFSLNTETVVSTLTTDYFQNQDGTVSDDAYYLVSTALDNRAGILQIDLGSFAVSAQLELDLTGLSSIGVTHAGELLYVVSPNDSTLKIIETSTLTQISETKVPGALNSVAVSVQNYQ
jgi:glutamine cyclotransferase